MIMDARTAFMRSSEEFKRRVEAKGAEVRLIKRGTAEQAGGVAVVAPAGYWSGDQTARRMWPVRPEKTDMNLFDEGRYDGGKGRLWDVWRLVPDPDGMVPVPREAIFSFSEEDRCVIVDAMDGVLYYGRVRGDDEEDIDELLDGVVPEE